MSEVSKFRTMVEKTLATRSTTEVKVDVIVSELEELLTPGALAAVEVLGARVPVSWQYNDSAGIRIGYGANGDVSRIEFGQTSVELEFHD